MLTACLPRRSLVCLSDPARVGRAAAYASLMQERAGQMQHEIRPAWNATPMRHAPAALKGLKPVTPEPWAADEAVYDRWKREADKAASPEAGYGVAERHLNKTARAKEADYKYNDYMARFDNKYADLNGQLDKYDGNPFT